MKNSALLEKKLRKIYFQKYWRKKRYFSFSWKIQSKNENIIFTRESMLLVLDKLFFFPKLERFSAEENWQLSLQAEFYSFYQQQLCLWWPYIALNKFEINCRIDVLRKLLTKWTFLLLFCDAPGLMSLTLKNYLRSSFFYR